MDIEFHYHISKGGGKAPRVFKEEVRNDLR
jgi:hypothetical protein